MSSCQIDKRHAQYLGDLLHLGLHGSMHEGKMMTRANVRNIFEIVVKRNTWTKDGMFEVNILRGQVHLGEVDLHGV